MKENFFRYFSDIEEEFGETDFLRDLRDGTNYTYEETMERSLSLASYLEENGVEKGDHVGIFMDNSPYWRISDLAVQALGAVNVSRYTEDLEELEYILEDSDSKFLLHDDELELDTGIKGLSRENMEEVFERYNEYSREKALKNSGLEDLNTIVYTSGTTSRPKGVELTHKNILSQVDMLEEEFKKGYLGEIDVDESDGLISLVPEWHMYQRTVENFVMSKGATFYFDSVRNFRTSSMYSEEINLIPGVPKLWMKVKKNIDRELEKELGEKTVSNFLEDKNIPGSSLVGKTGLGNFSAHDLYEKLYPRAVEYVSGEERSLLNRLSYKMVKDTVGEKLRDELGNNKLLMSGGSFLPGKVEEFFEVMGMPIVNGYGATETSPIISIKNFMDEMYTIGKPVNGVEVRTNEDSVLEVRGPNVFRKYYGKHEKTEESISEDGFYRTGDQVELTEKGNLRYVDRNDDVIVTSTGENVSPSKLETNIESYFDEVKDTLVFDGADLGVEDEIVAVLVPDEEETNGFVRKFKESKSDYLSEIRSHFGERGFPSHEKIDDVFIYPENNIPKTSTMKKKRERFLEELESNSDLIG